MRRFLYEHSVSYQGYLIIPFVLTTVESENIYSYVLLSELGHKDKFHKVKNPAKIYSSNLLEIIEIAQNHLDHYSTDFAFFQDAFKWRYTYQNHLIIVYQQADKYFYDHYQPDSLNNIAAPKIFKSEQACLHWIKQGLKIKKQATKEAEESTYKRENF